ncbi:MAG: DUF1570 domain-containing protein [Phycisphaerae bacterium]
MTATVIAAAFVLVSAASGQARLKAYETAYYIIHSDLDRDAVREAASRITAMAEMYHQRTSGFAGKITKKLPFYLYSKPEDYHAAGGMPGTAGIYDGKQLMAIAGRETGGATWHIVQHEGFHQFVHAVIGGDIPIWVNEGLAEYFAQGIYPGDGYVTGVVPPQRLSRLQGWINEGRTRSIEKMMTTSYAAWNAGLSVVNYDQAWSMVHFLAHAEGRRYQQAFNSFIKDVSRGMMWEDAWKKSFGTGTREFEDKWHKYWTEMPGNPTAHLYAKATVATLTSFYARAFSQRQIFRSFEEFREATESGRLKHHPDDWLPPRLLQDALKKVGDCGEWQVRRRSRGYELVCTMPDGTTLTGTFKIKGRRVKPGSVTVTVKRPRK